MKLRKITDRLATGIITAGGLALVLVVAGIMIFIVSQTIPLWLPAESDQTMTLDTPSILATPAHDLLAIGEEEQKEILYAVSRDGRLHFVTTAENRRIKTWPLTTPETLTSVVRIPFSHQFMLTTSAGRVLQTEIRFNTLFEGRQRTVVPEVLPYVALFSDVTTASATCVAAARHGGDLVYAWASGRLVNVFFAGQDTFRTQFTADGPILSLLINANSETILAGLDHGRVERWRWNPGSDPEWTETVDMGSGSRVTAMTYLIGETMVVSGTEGGHIGAWMLTPSSVTSDARTLTSIRTFSEGHRPITTIVPSWRNKSFLTGDADGFLRVYHSTSEQLLLEIRASTAAIRLAGFSPKSDGLVGMDQHGRLLAYTVNNPHPEVSSKTLWDKVWYESYDKPSYTWQSTGGTDDFEPKFSLVPLIFGTIKGTLYAMFFAVPLAIMGALYTSQFAHPRIRAVIKPTVEIMAALPSVVIGFLAGLWLAPLIKDTLPGFFLSIFLVPILLIGMIALLERMPRRFIQRFKFGYEFLLMIPALLLALFIGVSAGSWLEDLVMAGDAQHWLYTTLNVTYDQRNCIVVGIALAFASMPVIFTITEDSLSSVPAHLTSASLALGASRWQTAVRVVLPAASAGIFSAVMIGFGRAIGETMIVLMATGNTPIMDWSMFNGMRTLSANIAVEIPEAPHGGSLYRVLFLSGLILFLLTFVINTVAETVRQRLRKKYASL